MKNTYTIKEAQSSLEEVVRAAENGDCPVITRHEKTVAYVLSAERMASIVETMEVLANPKAMQAIRAHRAGKLKMFGVGTLKG